MSKRDRRARRAAREAKMGFSGGNTPLPPRGQGEETSALHEERLDAVLGALEASEATSVIDLGCGSGSLLERLAREPRFTRIVGVDTSAEALGLARRRLAMEITDDPEGAGRVSLVHTSLTEPPSLAGFDAATLVETIEHIDPSELSGVERAAFRALRPEVVIVTTPNADYNVLYGLTQGETRHADHRFEWGRARFARWAGGVADRHGYAVSFRGVGPLDTLHGSPTQLAVFSRRG